MILPSPSTTFRDSIAIYYSEADECWVAHSLRTDQIGMGDRVVDALAAVMRAVDHVFQAAAEDSSIQPLQPAPDEVVRLFERAQPLPREVYEIAHKIVHGQWPADLDIDVTPRDKRLAFAAEVTEHPG